MQLTYTADEELADVRMGRPHVVILGAGASRAACPLGDQAGLRLPLMADLASCLGIDQLLASWQIDPNENFEDIYSRLHNEGDLDKMATLNELVEGYFSKLRLPEIPTVYDHLVLSLRKGDVIATFNWDPLLLQAYRRSPRWLSKPYLAFLHGNVAIEFCDADEVTGIAGNVCGQCGNLLRRTPLLYPVSHKDYASDPAIAAHWSMLKSALKSAFMMTVFGYSGPKTDAEAINAMSTAWGDVQSRSMEQTAFITLQSQDEISAAWDRFIHTHHYEVQRDFFDSWIAQHPRRTGEAYISQYYDARFISNNPAPRGVSLRELWNWYDRFGSAELARQNES